MLGKEGLTIRSRKITVSTNGTQKIDNFKTEVNIGRLVGFHVTVGATFGDFDTIKVLDKDGKDLLPLLPMLRHKNNTTGTFLSTVIPVDYEANGEPITAEIVCTANADNDRHVFLEMHYKR
jgi:hypothetical protein